MIILANKVWQLLGSGPIMRTGPICLTDCDRLEF